MGFGIFGAFECQCVLVCFIKALVCLMCLPPHLFDVLQIDMVDMVDMLMWLY